ncbi:MAG TPA: hypothetical protein VJB67_00100 [Patescibacteria group bacterium]|nr:hypothetical protein [Patescibacteria group bacterium]
MKIKGLIFGLGLSAIILTAGVASVGAFGGNSGDPKSQIDPQRHQAIITATENGDYQAWSEAVGDRGHITEVITQDNFDQFVRMHQLIKDGDYEGANQIRAELGLQSRGPKVMGFGRFFNHSDGFTDSNGDGVCDHADLEK